MSHGLHAELARALLARGRPLFERAAGLSMAPFLPPGSELEVRAVAPEALCPGDIVLLEHGGRLIAHRVLISRTREGRVVTKGDRNPRPDPPLEPSQVLGLVIAMRAPGGERRALRGRLARSLGLVIALASPWLGLLVALRRRTRRRGSLALSFFDHPAAPPTMNAPDEFLR